MTFDSWKEMMSKLPTLNEQELQVAINAEVSTYRRAPVIGRLHQRYAKLRNQRERAQLIAGEILL